MAKTLTTCSWLLAALGAFVTLRYFPYASSWLPLGLLPYVLLVLAALSARCLTTRAVVLTLILASVSVGFWFFWDAFVHPSTLNLVPLEVVIVESLVAGATLLVVLRIERATHGTKRPHNNSFSAPERSGASNDRLG
ncbi:MAG: hypothetical protein AB1813_07065 [Verrucomicrobiota bacterium]